MRNNQFSKGFLTGTAVMIVLMALYIVNMPNAGKSAVKYTINGEITDKLDTLKQYVDECFLDDVNEEDMLSGACKGYIDALGDVYSAYYTAEEYREIVQSSSGEYCGVGIAVTENEGNGRATVVMVYEGTPAEEAGIKVGDIIYKVGGEEVKSGEIDQMVARLKGDEGTKVNITVYRKGKYIDMEVERRIISIPTINSKMLDDKIGYIEILQFDENTDEQFGEALEELKSQGMESVIFDVRDNPGGLYSTVCNMLDELLPEGTLVYTLDKKGEKEEVTSDERFLDMPMAVLINGNSASASEIFAGAIQDFEAGTIVGTRSFGKGIVQAIYPLDDGSAIKLTISKYYTPNGVNIHGKGITPDVEVDMTEGAKKDVQLEKAIDALENN